MNKLASNSLEILLSLFIVGGLLYVAFFVKPQASVEPYKPTLFGYRDNYFGVTTVSDTEDVIWSVGRNGRIIRSEDLGRTWQLQSSKTNSHLQDISVWNKDTALIVGDKGTVLLTKDGGNNWDKIELEIREFGDQLLSSFVDTKTKLGWVSGSMGSVYKSIDQGKSWKNVHEQEDISWNDVSVDPNGRVWIVGEFGRIQRSEDEGSSWTEIDSPTESSLTSIAFADEYRGVAVGISGVILSTEDGGDTWNKLDNVVDASLFAVVWDGQKYTATGLNGVILTAGAAGKEWQSGKIGTNNFAWYTQIAMHKGRLYIAGANLGVLENSRWQPFQ